MTRAFALAVIVSMAWHAVENVLAAQKPTVTREVKVEYRSRAATVDELWARSDAVVEVRVGSLVRSGALDDAIFSLYELRIDRVHKDSTELTAGSTVHLRRRGGTLELDTRIETQQVAGYPLFTEGERYLMFLRRSGDTPVFGPYFYETTYGPDSVFTVKAEHEDTPSHGQGSLTRELVKPGNLRAALVRLRAGR